VFVADEISDVSVGAAIASKLVHTSFIDPTPTVEMSPMPGDPLNDVADMGMSNNAGLTALVCGDTSTSKPSIVPAVAESRTRASRNSESTIPATRIRELFLRRTLHNEPLTQSPLYPPFANDRTNLVQPVSENHDACSVL
jgi:hypothetical protein